MNFFYSALLFFLPTFVSQLSQISFWLWFFFQNSYVSFLRTTTNNPWISNFITNVQNWVNEYWSQFKKTTTNFFRKITTKLNLIELATVIKNITNSLPHEIWLLENKGSWVQFPVIAWLWSDSFLGNKKYLSLHFSRKCL